jgi:hypothetical protein
MDFEAARAELIEQLGTEIKNKRVLAAVTWPMRINRCQSAMSKQSHSRSSSP